jgi:hypothetical protein
MAAMAKKKEEWLVKLRGITTTDQNIDTPLTLTSNSTANKKLKLKDVITSSICTIVDRTCCFLSTVTNFRVAHTVGNYLTSFFLLEEFLIHVIFCFPLNTPQLMADVLKILERLNEYQGRILKEIGGKF